MRVCENQNEEEKTKHDTNLRVPAVGVLDSLLPIVVVITRYSGVYAGETDENL